MTVSIFAYVARENVARYLARDAIRVFDVDLSERGRPHAHETTDALIKRAVQLMCWCV